MVGNAAFRDFYKNALLRQLHHPGPLSLGSSVVFAPHQDDETLGCGGTIIQKRQAGAPVWIVFLTDGSRSHKNSMGKEELKMLRMLEARAAGRVMGVPEEQIHFLQYPNGELKQHLGEAQKQVETLLGEIQPQEVFIPSLWDFHNEHRETALIVLAAIARLKADHRLNRMPIVYEYPIWFWYQWPMVGLPKSNPEERSRLLKRGLRYGFGIAFLTQFHYAVSVCSVLDVKRDALAQYASQTTRLGQSSDWTILQDVADGEFLRLFFQDCEIFRRVNM
jgi:LmbE family N-acetylglucosaminyl deacetylase